MDACNALIVDDEADIRELIEMTLLPLGVTCHASGGSRAMAYALLKNHAFGFCITDLRLPDGSGLELVAHIQRHYPNLPVAVITAHGNVESAVEALKLGAFDFMSPSRSRLAVLRNMVATALALEAAAIATTPTANRPILLGHVRR
jgi:two-component system response regulator PilR (NtrC family)